MSITKRTTITPTDAPSLLRVERRGARSEVNRIVSRTPLGLRVLHPEQSVCRVAIVQTAAMLLAGDRVGLEVEIGPGAACELVEISATVAHGTKQRAAIEQRLRVRIADGARLVLREQPLVIAAGTDLRRATTFELEGDACASHREMVVLGRHGERHGAAVLRTRVERDGAPVYDDTIDLRDAAIVRSPAMFGSARVLGTHALWGVPGALAEPSVFVLGSRDRVMKALARDASSAVEALDAFELRHALNGNRRQRAYA
jgi:urease accessory protein